jgi:hypothetical protein
MISSFKKKIIRNERIAKYMEGSDGGIKYCEVSQPCPHVYGQNDENSRLKIYFRASKTQGSTILEYK